MIEINLLPGSAKRSKRRGPKFTLPGPLQKLKGLPKLDRAAAIMAGCWVVGLGLVAWLFFGTRAKKSDLEAQIVAAKADSVRLADVSASLEAMRLRKDSISMKIAVVQEIDGTRYIWSHIMDEAARALPEHTWLVSILNVAADSGVKVPKFKIEGRTGNNFALANYMQQLEASPFIRGVTLDRSELVRENDKLVYEFILVAHFEPPPPDVIQTVPLFANEVETTDTAAAATPPAPAGRAGAPPAAGTKTGTAPPPRRPGTEEPR